MNDYPDYDAPSQGQKRFNNRGSNEVAISGPRLPKPAHVALADSDWSVLTDAIWPSAKSADSIALALNYCQVRKLDPFKRPVHIVPMYNASLKRMVETVWPGISELQTTAARTGSWAGMDEPKWGPSITRTFKGVSEKWNNGQKSSTNEQMEVTYPEWCSVTVYRMVHGVRCAFTEPVFWAEAYATAGQRSEVPNAMWAKRVRGQLLKCAKAASLRAAFPEEIGNDYSAEEMEGKSIDGGVIIPGTAEEVPNDPAQQATSKLDALTKNLATDRQGEGNAEPEQPKATTSGESMAIKAVDDIIFAINQALRTSPNEDVAVLSVKDLVMVKAKLINRLAAAYPDLHKKLIQACLDKRLCEGLIREIESEWPEFAEKITNAALDFHQPTTVND